MLGSLISAGVGLFNAKRQEKLQKEFAQNAISWKAADAQRAGISKVFAMGAPTHSYSPVSVGGLDQLGGAIDTAIKGQNTGGAANTNTVGKASGLATDLARAQITGVELDNDIKRAELQSKQAIANQPGVAGILDHDTTPAIPGQSNSGLKLKKELAPGGFGTGNKSFGVSPEVDMYKTKHGWSPQVPQELGEAQESQPLSAAQWYIRNNIMPSFSTAHRTFPFPAPYGKYWSFNPLFGEYVLKTLKGRQLEKFYPHP